jgi:putative transposase
MWPKRSPRVGGFPYQGFQRYLITIVTHERVALLSDATLAAGLAAQIPRRFGSCGFDVVAYCLMPDHVHLLLQGTAPDSDLREAVRRWKQVTGYEFKSRTGSFLWQPGFHDRVLREEDDTQSVVRYLLQNPVRAALVKTTADYPWIGSSRYTLADLEEYAGEWLPSWKRR